MQRLVGNLLKIGHQLGFAYKKQPGQRIQRQIHLRMLHDVDHHLLNIGIHRCLRRQICWQESFGIDAFQLDGSGKITENWMSDRNVTAMQKLNQWVFGGTPGVWYAAKHKQVRNDGCGGMFAKGNVPMACHSLGVMTESCLESDVEFGIVPLPKMDEEQKKEFLSVKCQISGKPIKESRTFTFTLNPGFRVTAVTQDGTPLTFKREDHLLWVEFPDVQQADSTVRFTIGYEGGADERICYLDIPEELLIEQEKFMRTFNVGKRYVYQTEDYTLLTPESYWYPRPGVCYSDESPDWQQSYFSHFQLSVKPNQGLTALSQGKRELANDSTTTTFTLEYPLQSLSLIIGKYHDYSINVDDTHYAVWYLDGHDFFSKELDLIQDTLYSIIEDVRYQYENHVGMYYPFKRFSIIETPAHFSSYQRTWTQAQEKMQPEMVLVSEKMYNNWRFDVKGQKKWRKERGGRGGRGRRGGGSGPRGAATHGDDRSRLCRAHGRGAG